MSDSNRWTFTHDAVSTASPARLYALWADVDRWPTWNVDLTRADLHGPFAAGSHIDLAGPDGTLRLRLAEVEPDRLFVDEVALDGLVVRTTHALDPLGDGRTRVVYRLEIHGAPPAEVAEIGAAITADFPDKVAALVRLAQR